jgi:hypothetical protein
MLALDIVMMQHQTENRQDIRKWLEASDPSRSIRVFFFFIDLDVLLA